MVHIEDKYVKADGSLDTTGALADGSGLAVLGIFFRVDNMKPQVSSYRQSNIINTRQYIRI